MGTEPVGYLASPIRDDRKVFLFNPRLGTVRLYALVYQLLDALRFSTKERRRSITKPLQERLWPYLGGIARANKMKAVAIGGIEDHAHVLISLPSTLAIAKAIQLLKGNSSKWVHDTFRECWDFEWQEGYGAFSVGISGVPETIQYIEAQAEHHRKRTFQEEFVAILKKHEMEYDEKRPWD